MKPKRADFRLEGGDKKKWRNCPMWNHRSSAPPELERADFRPEKAN